MWWTFLRHAICFATAFGIWFSVLRTDPGTFTLARCSPKRCHLCMGCVLAVQLICDVCVFLCVYRHQHSTGDALSGESFNLCFRHCVGTAILKHGDIYVIVVHPCFDFSCHRLGIGVFGPHFQFCVRISLWSVWFWISFSNLLAIGIFLITLSRSMMTHVLDRWCSDWKRIGCLGHCMYLFSFHCHSYFRRGILPRHLHFDITSWDRYKGSRVGEAKNPGPDLVVTVSNPTSLNQKHLAYQQLPGHVHCVAETAMTQTLIEESEPLYRAAGFKCHWGAPVPSHRLNKCGLPTRRGTATGVAILTKDVHSIRCFESMPGNWHSTCRIVESMIRVNSIDIKVICIYGVQSSAQNAKANTNALLCAAMYRSQTFPGPCIVAGDFNFRPNELEAWETCTALGFVDLTVIAQQRFPHKVFPTCRDSTNHDTILVNQPLSERLIDFQVHIDKKFDVHAPLSVTLQLPVNGLFRSTWKLPIDISKLGLEKFILHESYRDLATDDIIDHIMNTSANDPDDAFRQWAILFEKSVDQGLRTQKSCGAQVEQGCLRPFHKGRGALPKIVREHVPISFKKGCSLNYTPQSDASNVKLRQMTKQVRRVQALFSRVAKWNREYGDFFETFIENDDQMASYLQINSEWWAIVKAKGFENGFLNWLADPDRLGFRFLRMPTKDGLKVIEGILKNECDRMTKEFQAFRKKAFKVKVNVDVLLLGGTFTYKLLRPASKPMLQTLTSTQNFTCELQRSINKGVALYKISPQHLVDPDLPLYCDDLVLKPPHKFHNSFLVIDGDTKFHQPKFVATQHLWITDEISLHTNVSHFWNQFWRRDSDDDKCNEIKFDRALQIIQDALPKWDTLDIHIAPEHYQKRAQSMKSTAARGCDGFCIGEIKLFSLQMWQHLSSLLNSFVMWPQVLTYCKTIMLPKKDVEGGPEATRPITIAAIIYRIWATVHAKAILIHWSYKLPRQVSGGIPQRGTLDLILECAIEVELSQFHSEPLSGFVLDLEKAFNALPRCCIYAALSQLGVPNWLIAKWRLHLKHLTRCLVIGQNIQLGCLSTTGVPEGDALSILAMTALSFAWKCYIAHPNISSYSYADNLEWNSHDHLIHRATLTKTLELMNAMYVRVSPTKSWAWALDKKGNLEWKKLWLEFFPDHKLCLQQNAVDLGVELHYNKKRKHTIIPARFDAAIERAKKLEKLPANCDVKAKIVLTSVIPTAVYGLELAYAGKKLFHTLRTAISKCFVGNYKSTNPWLVCALFGVKGTDPELHFIIRLFRFVRKFAIKNEIDSHTFWHLVLMHDGNTNRVYGPAAVFAQACLRLEWTILEPGIVKTHLGDEIHLSHSDVKLLESRIHDAWDAVVLREITHRVNLKNIGDFSLPKTRQLLGSLPCHQRVLVVMQIAGCIQTNVARCKYQSGVTEKCLFCDSKDTVMHRFFHCPVTEPLRVKFDNCIHDLKALPRWLLNCPLVPKHIDFRYHNIITATRKLPNTPEHISSQPTMVFTDASMFSEPAHTVSDAAFAVISIPDQSNHECNNLVAEALGSARLPDFKCHFTGKVVGRQTVNRGELMAGAVALDVSSHLHLVVDSQYTLDLLKQIQTLPSPVTLCNHDNFDIIELIWHKMNYHKHTSLSFEKIKSHMEIQQDMPCDLILKIWGNSHADEAAKLATTKDILGFTQMHEQVVQHDVHYCKVLRNFYLFITEVVALFQTAFSKIPEQTSVPFVDRFDALNMWPKERCVCPIVPTFSPEIVKCMYFTETYTRRLIMWLCKLQWPPQRQSDDPGVSFLELFLDFYLATHSLPPVNVSGLRNTNPEYKLVGEGVPNPALTLKPRLMHQTLRVFEYSLKYVSKLFGGHLFPAEYCGQTFCLSHLGVKGIRGGMTVRPSLLYSDQVLMVISKTAHNSAKHFSVDNVDLESREFETVDALINVPFQDSDHSRTGTSYMHFKKYVRQLKVSL